MVAARELRQEINDLTLQIEDWTESARRYRQMWRTVRAKLRASRSGRKSAERALERETESFLEAKETLRAFEKKNEQQKERIERLEKELKATESIRRDNESIAHMQRRVRQIEAERDAANERAFKADREKASAREENTRAVNKVTTLILAIGTRLGVEKNADIERYMKDIDAALLKLQTERADLRSKVDGFFEQ